MQILYCMCILHSHTNLKTPISEKIKGLDAVTKGPIDVRNKCADKCTPEVAGVEGLCNVGRTASDEAQSRRFANISD